MPQPPLIHVVIADDDPDDVELARIILVKECPQAVIHHLGNERDWDGFLSDPAATPALVLMDFRFGPLNGLEMLAQLKSLPLFATTPVLVWSGSVNEAEVKASLEAGAAGFMLKPDGLEEFTRTMKTICEVWLT